MAILLPARGSFTSRGASLLTRPRWRVLSNTAVAMVRNRGLEVNREGPTPTEGGMTLYCKAGPDGKSLGDCPFAHFVRMVLEEKKLEYELVPCVQETKPAWLVEYYEGKMPALRHRKECYTESDVIAEYLDYFFPQPALQLENKDEMQAAESATQGLFPSIAKYFKHTPDGDESDLELMNNLKESLQRLEAQVAREGRTGPFLAGKGDAFTLLDCSLAPKLYHMETGLEAFKGNKINISTDFPALRAYMDAVFSRESFVKTVYPKDLVTWGWGNARA